MANNHTLSRMGQLVNFAKCFFSPKVGLLITVTVISVFGCQPDQKSNLIITTGDLISYNGENFPITSAKETVIYPSDIVEKKQVTINGQSVTVGTLGNESLVAYPTSSEGEYSVDGFEIESDFYEKFGPILQKREDSPPPGTRSM